MQNMVLIYLVCAKNVQVFNAFNVMTILHCVQHALLVMVSASWDHAKHAHLCVWNVQQMSINVQHVLQVLD